MEKNMERKQTQILLTSFMYLAEAVASLLLKANGLSSQHPALFLVDKVPVTLKTTK